MFDDPTKTAEESSGDETTTQDTPSGEEQTTENVETQTPTDPADPGEGSQETTTQQEHKMTRGEKRLQRLLHRDEDELGDDDSKSQLTTQNRENLPTPPWYQPQVDDGDVITPEQYQADVVRAADEIASTRIKQFEQKQGQQKAAEKQVKIFNSTLATLEKKFPTLDPDSDKYDEKLSEKVANLYQKAAGKKTNPELLEEIVSTVMETSEQARVSGQSQASEALADQSAQSAVSPTGTTQRTELSQAEMARLKRENPAKLAEMLGKKLSWVE